MTKKRQNPSDDSPAESPRVGRRDFIARAAQITVGACGAVSLAGAARLAMPNTRNGRNRVFPLGTPGDFKVNTLTWVRERDLFVMRDEAGIGAFSARCTHLGCTVRQSAEGFFCPCHGAEFDALGGVVKGPARDPLPWFRVWSDDDGRLWVDARTPLDDPGPKPVTLPEKGAG